MTTAFADILVLTTGGTIDKVYHDALSDYSIGEPIVPTVLTRARNRRSVRVVELMRKDSLDLDAADRALIVTAIRDAREDRIIVTHGTDTMTDTAQSIGSVVDRTIVLVGAFAPARFADSDAAFNLGMAFATVQVAPRGVWIAMNGNVFGATTVRKDRADGSFVSL